MARTLLEEVSLLHDVATRWEQDATLADEGCGRHYYDVYRLLDHAPTRSARGPRGLRANPVGDAGDIRDPLRRLDQAAGGRLRLEPRVSAEPGSELREWLEERYGDEAGLLPVKVSGDWPSLAQVLKRVHKHAELL